MLNTTSEIKTPSLCGKIVKGVVVDNNDPLKLGRLRIRIANLHSSKMSDSEIPWILPLNFNANVNSQCTVAIPDIGTDCWVVFPSNDLYSGIYIGSLANIPEEFSSDYPNVYGFIDRSGSMLFVNTETDNYIFNHVSGTTLSIDGKGHGKVIISDYSENNKAISNNSKGLSFEINGDFKINCTGDFKINCKNYNINCTENSAEQAKSISYTSESTISMNAADSFTANSPSGTMSMGGGSVTMQSLGSIDIIGKNGNFGGINSSVDGHAGQIYTIEGVTFYAFNPSGISPSPNIPKIDIKRVLNPSVNLGNKRKRQAYNR